MITVVRPRFILTNDMAPVHYIKNDRGSGALTSCSTGFVCPLPKGYQRVINECSEWLYTETMKMIEQVQKDAFHLKGAFFNVFVEYPERTPPQLKKLKRLFGFTHILYSKERGLFSITAGGDCNSGDIYLATDASYYYEFAPADGFQDKFEPHHAWHCHNVDFYWQAVEDREVAVRYFNILYGKLRELEQQDDLRVRANQGEGEK